MVERSVLEHQNDDVSNRIGCLRQGNLVFSARTLSSHVTTRATAEVSNALEIAVCVTQTQLPKAQRHASCCFICQEGTSMNQDELEGKAEALKGKVKQAVGNATNDPDLVDEGTVDEAAGKTQDAFGRTRRKVGEFIEDVGDGLKK